MEQVLHVEWSTGHMNVIMDKFFPCSKADFNKLLKIIDLDWEHCDELRETLKVYFQNRIPNLPKEAETLQKKAAAYRVKATDCKERIKADLKERKENGLAPEPYNHLETEYKNNICLAKQAEREAMLLLNSKPKFEEYIKLSQRR